MTKKLTTLVITLFLMAVSITACKDKDVPQTNQRSQYTYEDMSEEEYERELQRMREEGILDENGQPMPGVDLNDYPGLG